MPGSSGATDIGLAATKIVLRLAGGDVFAEAIGDLTGIGRMTIQRLVLKSQKRIAPIADVEYREVPLADRDWAEEALLRTYQALASRVDHAMPRESLRGADALTALAFDCMEESDRTALGRVSEDTRE